MPDKHEVGGSSPLGPTSRINILQTEITTNHYYGGVAQLGEHLPCKQGVMGSNPIISTMGRKSRQIRDLSSITESMLRENSLWVPEIAKRFNEIDAMRISHESPSSPPNCNPKGKQFKVSLVTFLFKESNREKTNAH